MASNLPDISSDIIDGFFTELSGMDVMLDYDPLEFGPKRLNAKVAEARDHLTRCEQIFIKLSQWLQVYNRACRAAQLDFDLAMQNLMANDPETRSGRNVADRNAIATMKMRTEREDLDRLNVTIQDLEAVMAVVRSKRADLRDVQGRLRDQVRLCQEDIGLGSRWGSKPATGSVVPDLDSAPAINARDLAETQELLAFVESPENFDLSKMVPSLEEEDIPVSHPMSESPALDITVPVETLDLNVSGALQILGSDLPAPSSQDEVDSFLDALEVQPKISVSDDIDIDDLLNGI